MMRWLSWVAGVGFCLGMVAGCGPKVFLHESDLNDARRLIPEAVEHGEPVAGLALTPPVPTPASVDHADRPPRHITLQEAIAIALDSGSSAANTGAIGNGLADDRLNQFTGSSTNGQTDKLRVLALNPAIANAVMEQSLARYDAVFTTSMNWTVTDNLTQGLSSFSNGQAAQFNSSIVKAFSSGGTASVGIQNEYRLLTEPPTGFGVFNPFYTTRLNFGFEQPLLQNWGTEINQLLNRTPAVTGAGVTPDAATAFNTRGAVLGQLPQFTGTGTEGILVARLRLDAQRSEFERNVNSLLLNVEAAYWNLYQAYGQLYAYEEVLRVAHKSWVIFKAKYEAGAGKGAEDYFPALAQYEEFRGNRLTALGEVLDRERNLRRLIGLPVEDGTRLVPITPPTLAPFVPDWETARQEALARRPELGIARDNLRAAQYNLIVAKNFLKPDLRFFARYSPVGFGTQLSGGGTLTDAQGDMHPNSSLGSLAGGNFEDWTLGLNFTVPLGQRLEHSVVRAARLGLAQAYASLQDQEDRATSQLQLQYQKLAENYRLIEARRAERKAYAEAVEVRFKKVIGGVTILDTLLDSTRRLAAAQVKEYQSIAEYNNSIARFEWAKGTIMQHDNVHIAEGPLPVCAQIRAVDHERDRSKALVLCDRPDPTNHPGRMVASTEHDILAVPPQIQLPGGNGEGGHMSIPDAPKSKGPDLEPQKLPMPRPFSSKAGPAMPKDVRVDIDLLDPVSTHVPSGSGPITPAAKAPAPISSAPIMPAGTAPTPGLPATSGPTPSATTPARPAPSLPGEPMIRIPLLPGTLPEVAPASSSR